MNPRSKGFTLIELLVVISILGLLMAVLLPQVLGQKKNANLFADQANLKWHFINITTYRSKHKRVPKGGGHQFVFGPWVAGVVGHTPQNVDRYFSPQLSEKDEYYQEILEEDPKTIWKSIQETESTHTHYAGRAREHKRTMDDGNEIIMCTDNEDGNIYDTGEVVILTGDGSTRVLNLLDHFSKVGYVSDPDEEQWIQVGPDSLHEGLQKLSH